MNFSDYFLIGIFIGLFMTVGIGWSGLSLMVQEHSSKMVAITIVIFIILSVLFWPLILACLMIKWALDKLIEYKEK